MHVSSIQPTLDSSCALTIIIHLFLCTFATIPAEFGLILYILTWIGENTSVKKILIYLRLQTCYKNVQSNTVLISLTFKLLLNLTIGTVYHNINLRRFINSLITCLAKVGSNPLFCSISIPYYQFQTRVENYIYELIIGHSMMICQYIDTLYPQTIIFVIILVAQCFLTRLTCSMHIIKSLLKQKAKLKLYFSLYMDYINRSFYCFDYKMHLQYSIGW